MEASGATLKNEAPVDKDTDKDEWRKLVRVIVSQFRELKESPDTWTIPFAPWCGEKYWEAKPRILFVGKSVGAFNDKDAEKWTTKIRDWQKSKDPSLDPEKLTHDYVTNIVANSRQENPAFWVIPFLIAAAFSPVNSTLENLAHSFAWSNLYKVNDSKRKNFPPRKAMRQPCGDNFCLLEKSVRWLKQEIEILKPDFVLLGIGKKEWNQIKGELPTLENTYRGLPMKVLESRNAVGHSPLGIWVTYHFSRWTANQRENQHGSLLFEMKKAWSESLARVER